MKIEVKNLLSQIYKFNNFEIGLILFNIGIIFLLSAPALASIFLTISLLISFSSCKIDILKDRLNIILIILITIMILSCTLPQLRGISTGIQNIFHESTNPYYGLINWIPYVFIYWGFKAYLKTKRERIFFSFSLIIGTVPLLISGLGQYIFDWYGPFKLWGGFIIWYQREITSGGLTGFFNNQNYAGCVLATTFPFFLISFLKEKNKFLKKNILLGLNILVFISIIFTTSRNAFLSFFVGLIFLIFPLKFKYLCIGLIAFLLVILSSFYFQFNFISYLQGFNFDYLIMDQRNIIWENARNYIIQKPLLGWGGNGFASIWNSNIGVDYYGHSHNLLLEIAIKYGLITTILLSIFVFSILIKGFKKIYINSSNKIKHFKNYDYDIAWYSSTIVVLFSNLFDIFIYDLRINLLIWILLAGLKNIVDEKN